MALGEPAIASLLSGLTTAEQAQLGSCEAKSIREKHRDRRVMVSFPAGEQRPGLAGRPRDFLDLDWADLDAFGVLVQVENLDGFCSFEPTMPALLTCRSA